MSDLFKQAMKNREQYSEVDLWHYYRCNICKHIFTMKIDYQDGYPFISGSTKKCKHNDYEEIDNKDNDK